MATGRPSKPLSLVKGHRTKAEKAVRETGEKSTISGSPMKEWPEVKSSPAAHSQFVRLKALYKKLSKDDALYESTINRYCIIHAEALRFETRLQDLEEKLEAVADNPSIDAAEQLRLLVSFAQAVGKLETNLMSRRKMLLDIEKESALTLAAALRSVPKKPEEKKATTGMAGFLQGRGGG